MFVCTKIMLKHVIPCSSSLLFQSKWTLSFWTRDEKSLTSKLIQKIAMVAHLHHHEVDIKILEFQIARDTTTYWIIVSSFCATNFEQLFDLCSHCAQGILMETPQILCGQGSQITQVTKLGPCECILCLLPSHRDPRISTNKPGSRT